MMTVGKRRISKGDVIRIITHMFSFRASPFTVTFEINQDNEVIQIIIGSELFPPLEMSELYQFSELLRSIDTYVETNYAYQR